MGTNNHGMDDDDLHLWLSQSQSAPSQLLSMNESDLSDLSTSAASVQTNVREIQQIIKQNNTYLTKQNDVLFRLVNDISVHVAEISDKMGIIEKKFCAINRTVKNNKDVISEVQRILERLQTSTRDIKKQAANLNADKIEMRLKTLENKLMTENNSRGKIRSTDNDDKARNSHTDERSRSAITGSGPEDAVSLDKNTLLVHNLPYGMQDEIDINQMLHDALGLELHVKTVIRAPSVNSRAGVLTIELHSSDDLRRVMQSKMKLRNHRRYYDVYIEENDHHRESMIDEKIKMLVESIQCGSSPFFGGNRNLRTRDRYPGRLRNGRYRNNHHQQ